MYVNSVSALCCKKPHFMAAPRKVDNLNKKATLQDLYGSEDRIMEHNEELIRKQNELLSVALMSMAKHVNSPSPGTYDKFQADLIELGTNGNFKNLFEEQ